MTRVAPSASSSDDTARFFSGMISHETAHSDESFFAAPRLPSPQLSQTRAPTVHLLLFRVPPNREPSSSSTHRLLYNARHLTQLLFGSDPAIVLQVLEVWRRKQQHELRNLVLFHVGIFVAHLVVVQLHHRVQQCHQQPRLQ